MTFVEEIAFLQLQLTRAENNLSSSSTESQLLQLQKARHHLAAVRKIMLSLAKKYPALGEELMDRLQAEINIPHPRLPKRKD